jgi:hypothetical protein
MRKIKGISILAVITLVVLAACEKTDELSVNSIVGTYVGTLTSGNDLKSQSVEGHGDDDATAEVTKTSDGKIKVHCYSSELDTTFMLDYYEHNDSIKVCLNGDDFENMYGHMMGQDHMSGGMMGDMNNGETEWMHHMNDEHDEGDEHFGGFDMMRHSFSYTFKMNDGDYHFQGTKK